MTRLNKAMHRMSGMRVRFRFGCLQMPLIGDLARSSVLRRSSRITNPQGWQRVAGGRSGAKTPGSGFADFCIPEGCRSSETPPWSAGNSGPRSGGVAALDPRLASLTIQAKVKQQPAGRVFKGCRWRKRGPRLSGCADERRTTNDLSKRAKPFQDSEGNQEARQAAKEHVPPLPVPRALGTMS